MTLVAVSKSFSESVIEEALQAGQHEFGENYVQEFRQKLEKLPDKEIKWHFIGHLQTNKVKYVVGSITLLHSVDSLHIAEEIQRQAEKRDCTVDILIEVRTTDEATKTGVAPDKVIPLIEEIAKLDRINVDGLMTIGPFLPDPERARPCFRQLRQIRDEIRSKNLQRVHMKHLSMGMTNDFIVAIEEGSTILRIGSAIFGSRQPGKISDN